MLIPMAGYAYESISPLNEMKDIDAHLNAIEILTELAYTSKLLLAAQYRSKGKDIIILTTGGREGYMEGRGWSTEILKMTP